MTDEVHFMLSSKFMSASRRCVICSHFGSVFVVHVYPLSKGEFKGTVFKKKFLEALS